jgi:hypothetical protein
MCNLYSITTSQTAIIALFRVINRDVGSQRGSSQRETPCRRSILPSPI